MRACMRSSSPKRAAALPRYRLRIGCRRHPCVSGQDRSRCLELLSAMPHIVMPGLVPLLSGLDLGDRAHGLNSTGLGGVRRDRNSDRHPAARPRSRHTRLPYRHARTCSTAVRFGFCGQDAWPGFKRVSKGPVEPGLRSTPGAPPPFIVMPSYRHARTCSGHPCGRRDGPDGDARNKSGYDERGVLGHNGAGPCIGAILKRSPGNAG